MVTREPSPLCEQEAEVVPDRGVLRPLTQQAERLSSAVGVMGPDTKGHRSGPVSCIVSPTVHSSYVEGLAPSTPEVVLFRDGALEEVTIVS